MPEQPVERAQWKRFGTSPDRCFCGQPIQVSITITAQELTGDKGSTKLASERHVFCDQHALVRMQNASKAMMQR